MRILFFLFIVMPIIEMLVLIKVGGMIGAWNTIGLVLLTAMLGMALLKQQGPRTLLRAQTKMQKGELPAKEMIEGIFLAVGGALLLTPGFVTDALGFCCLLPGIRHVIIGWGLKQFKNKASNNAQAHFHFQQSARGERVDERVIEGEFEREEERK